MVMGIRAGSAQVLRMAGPMAMAIGGHKGKNQVRMKKGRCIVGITNIGTATTPVTTVVSFMDKMHNCNTFAPYVPNETG